MSRILETGQALQIADSLRQFVTPEAGRKFSEMYNVQRLETNYFDYTSNVCIATIQSLSSFFGEKEKFSEVEGDLFFDRDVIFKKVPGVISYNPRLPIEYFDVIFVDECHRSIYSQWRPVLEYFDAFLVGYTATPDERTYTYFHEHLVYTYNLAQAISDGVAVDYDIISMATTVYEQNAYVELQIRDKKDLPSEGWPLSDWEFLRESPPERFFMSTERLRMIIKTFRESLFTEFGIFPERKMVPKTLIFAKNERQADDIVQIVLKEFNEEDAFVQKITSSMKRDLSNRLINRFCFSHKPRIVVTVNMLLGLDIRPLEIILLMRPIRSRVTFEQILGMGCRTISQEELLSITPDAKKKKFTIIETEGVIDEISSLQSTVLAEDVAHSRFSDWFATQEQTGRRSFTDEQILWLRRIRDRIITNGPFTEQDFERSPFTFDGGLTAARLLFGNELSSILQELNRLLTQEI